MEQPFSAYFSLPFYTKSTPRSPLYLDRQPPSIPFSFIHIFTTNSSVLVLHIPVCSRSQVTRHARCHATPVRSPGHHLIPFQPSGPFNLLEFIISLTAGRIACIQFAPSNTCAVGSPVTCTARDKHLRGHIQSRRARPSRLHFVRTHTDGLPLVQLVPTCYPSAASYRQATLEADSYLTLSTYYASARSPVT
jgi:hypothetical protein